MIRAGQLTYNGGVDLYEAFREQYFEGFAPFFCYLFCLLRNNYDRIMKRM